MSHLFPFLTPWNMDKLSPSELDGMLRALKQRTQQPQGGRGRRG